MTNTTQIRKKGRGYQVREITYKYRKLEVPEKFKDIRISSPDDVYNNFRFLFDGEMREKFYVIWLNTSHTVTGWDCISIGNLNASIVHPREVFSLAVKYRAAGIILMHNHPSGNVEPSNEDKHITRQLVEAGKILGIPVLDHAIFGDNKYTTFAERGLL